MDRIHVVADLGRAARKDPMPFVLTYVTTGEEIASAATAELAEALATALRDQARAVPVQAGVKWHQAKLAAIAGWSAYCFLCDRNLFVVGSGPLVPLTVVDPKYRQGVCLECKATTKVYVSEHTPVGRTR